MNLQDFLETETDRIEWKESDRDVDGMYHAVCALANDLGATGKTGVLMIGVSPQGKPDGIDRKGLDLDKVMQNISNRLHATKLQPTPAFSIRFEEIDRRHLILVSIDPYPVPPIITVNSTAWVRQGTTTRRATEADLQRLRERRPENTLPFDLRPFPGTGLEDLDLIGLRRFHDAARADHGDPETFPGLEHWLTQQQFGRDVDGQWMPNPAALLIYGNNPQSWLPGARTEFVRYAGVDIDSTIVSRKRILGTLPDQLDALWIQIEANLSSVPIADDGIRNAFAPLYPLNALKELARNLVQHRLYEGTHAPGRVEWYEDRIEFSNPGGPFGRASDGEFGSHTDYRNPIITKGLVDLGYVEQLGRGIRSVRLLLERNGNPPFDVEVDGFTRITTRKRL